MKTVKRSGSIEGARENAFKRVSDFIKLRNKPGTIAWLFKNGFGKSTLQVRIFKEFDDTCMLAQSHKHIKKVLIPKLKAEGLEDGVDFVYYQPMEMLCSTFQEVKKNKELFNLNTALRELFVPAKVRHSEIIKCNDPYCPYTEQEWLISKDNPDRIPKTVASVTMFIKKELQYKSEIIIIDELDGIMDPEPVKCQKELIEKYIGEPLHTLSNDLGIAGFLNQFGMKIKEKNTIISEIDEWREKTAEDLNSGKIHYGNDLRDEIKEKTMLYNVATDGLVIQEDGDWYANNRILRVPRLFQIVNALTDQERYITKKIIVSMARMRKNPILKRKFTGIFTMLIEANNNAIYENIRYKGFKAESLLPFFEGEDCDFPNDHWIINVKKPPHRTSFTAMDFLFRDFDSSEEIREFSIRAFLEIDRQIAEITTKFNRKYGLLITFKALIEWIKKERKLGDEELKEQIKNMDKKTEERFIKAIKSKKWDFLRLSEFGNASAGTDMQDNEKFLIVYGNWFNGEYGKFNGLLFPDPANNYRLTVMPDLNERLKNELQNLILRDYMEYPLRSRRKIPTYCITDYFTENDRFLREVTKEILSDYNTEPVFY